MNNKLQDPQEQADVDDQALGSALGSALGARVNAEVVAPPVSLIAKRAAAQARARAVQRTVVGIAASITLLAGGVFAYNAFESDNGAPTVATDPTVDTTPNTETPTTVAPDEVSTPDDASASALTWSEHDASDQFGPDLLDVYQVETVGDGRVFARAWGDAGSQIIISEVVGDWTKVAIPTGVSLDHIDISGDRWLLAGLDTSGPLATIGPDNTDVAFYSDDQGANWSELTINLPSEEQSSIVMALASGQHMVVVTKIVPDRTELLDNVSALIAAQGLVPDEDSVESWSLQGNTVTFSTEGSSDTQSFEINDDELSELNRNRAQGNERVRVYSSDGSPAKLTAEYESRHTTGFSNAEGFYIALTTPTDELLLTSPDGVTWTETSIDNASGFAAGLRTATRVDEWFVGGYDGELRIKSLDQLGDPDLTTATMAGMQQLISLDVGPAGMVAAAFPTQVESGQPEAQVGWSIDGTNWQWQTPSDAFGIAQGQASSEGLGISQASVELAVGTDFILAHVMGFAPVVESDVLEAQPPRWFMATVQ